MRDVAEDPERPARVTLPRPERFTPEAILVRLPAWRANADGSGEMLVERAERWDRLHPIFVAALASIQEGHGFEETYRRALVAGPELKPNHVRIFLRKFYWQLHEMGHVRIPLEEAPDVFDGRYTRLRELGRGGIGVAHLCRDGKTDGLVVVKHAWGYRQPADRADRSLRQEGEVLKRLDHPRIARFHDEFEVEGLYHLVRGYAEGEPLLERAKGRGVPDRGERIRLALDVADILAHVHERGFLFLDVTPGNFVLLDDGSPLVIDVGICRPHVAGRATYDGSAGSRGYAAPEVVARGGIGTWSDVFGFGCLFQFLLTGRAPRHLATLEVRHGALVEAGAADDEREFVLACCADRPDARPAGMADVATRLRALSPPGAS